MTAAIKIRDPDTRADLSRDLRTKREYEAAYDQLMLYAVKVWSMRPEDADYEPDISCEDFCARVAEPFVDLFSAEQWAAWRSL